jgi:hypothetical protein
VFDVYLTETDVFQPDILIVLNAAILFLVKREHGGEFHRRDTEDTRLRGDRKLGLLM